MTHSAKLDVCRWVRALPVTRDVQRTEGAPGQRSNRDHVFGIGPQFLFVWSYDRYMSSMTDVTHSRQ